MNELNEEPIEEITLSSINSAKMAALLADLLVNHRDLVASAEWNRLLASESPAYVSFAVSPEVPSDPAWWFYPSHGVAVEEGWRYSLGTGVPLAVIDRGFDVKFHPELSRVVEKQQGFNWFGWAHAPGEGVEERDYTAKDPESAKAWHGTTVALAAVGEHHNGIGMAGVAPNSRLWTVKGGDSSFSFTAAVEWAANNGAKVMNISQGMEKNPWWKTGNLADFYSVNWVLDNAISKHPDLIVVVAAGNDDRFVDDYIPQDRRDVIVVGGLAGC